MKKRLRGRRQTILIVEDDREVLGLLIRILSTEGYKIMKAENAYQALRIAAQNMPDLVILDLILPDCNGIQLLNQLKAMNETIQVIILTGYGSKDVARSAMETGAFDFFTKPFDFHDLRASVREALVTGSPGVRGEKHYL
jgi:DNA-binding NtrC family response regulator